MKTKKIRNVLNQLDGIPLPDKEKMLTLIQRESGGQILTSTSFYAGQSRYFKFKTAIVLCIAFIILVGGVSGYTLVSEAKEYDAAVMFFNENSLSDEGLTRNEIKKVYRDITTGKFLYDKTAEVLKKSMGGYEIFQDEPTTEDLQNLWDYKNSGYHYVINRLKGDEEISYDIESLERYDTQLGYNVYDKTIVTKCVDGKEIWSVEINAIVLEEYVTKDSSVIIYGANPTYSSSQTVYGRIVMIDKDGNVLWDRTSANGFNNEYYSKVICDGDGITVFSRGDFNYLCCTRYDYNGQILKFTKNEVGNYGMSSAVSFGDGYLVQLNNSNTGDLIYKVNSDGTLSDSFTYIADDEEYYINSLSTYNGQIYLSTYAVPKPEEGERSYGGRYEIAEIIDYIIDKKDWNIENDELTNLVRSHYTAVLLVCDPESGIPEKFYSVKGSVGGKLSVNEERKLLWDVESITDTYFSPGTSSFTIGGACHVYRYNFDETGMILKQEKTGEVTEFRR